MGGEKRERKGSEKGMDGGWEEKRTEKGKDGNVTDEERRGVL